MGCACRSLRAAVVPGRLESHMLHVRQLKAGLSTTHPLRVDEIKVIKNWLAEQVKMKPEMGTFFVNERRVPLSWKTAWLMICDYDRLAGLPVEAHRTCSTTRVALLWPTRAQTRGSFKPTWDTG